MPSPTESAGGPAERPARALTTARTAVLVTVVLWASAFVGIRAALPHFPPAHLALLRYLIASVALVAAAPFVGVRVPSLRDLPVIALTGLVGIAAYNVLLNTGEQTVTAGAASMIVAGVPVMTAVLSAAFLGERMGPRGWLGLAVCFAGSAIIATAGQEELRFERGAVLLLLAALALSIYFVLQKPLLRRYSPLALVSYAIWGGTLYLLTFAPGLVSTVRTASTASTLAVVYLGIFPAAVAYVAYAYALAAMPAGRTASFLYLVPVVTVLIEWLWLRELPTMHTLLGGSVVMAGVLLVNARRRPVAVRLPPEQDAPRVEATP